MKYVLKNFAFKASLTLNCIVILAALIGFAAVRSNAAEGYVSVSANFGKPAVEQIAVKVPAAPEVAFNAMPVPARKPKVTP
jgi:hypothetical protein